MRDRLRASSPELELRCLEAMVTENIVGDLLQRAREDAGVRQELGVDSEINFSRLHGFGGRRWKVDLQSILHARPDSILTWTAASTSRREVSATLRSPIQTRARCRPDGDPHSGRGVGSGSDEEGPDSAGSPSARRHHRMPAKPLVAAVNKRQAAVELPRKVRTLSHEAASKICLTVRTTACWASHVPVI